MRRLQDFAQSSRRTSVRDPDFEHGFAIAQRHTLALCPTRFFGKNDMALSVIKETISTVVPAQSKKYFYFFYAFSPI
jgi:hypothetical protein